MNSEMRLLEWLAHPAPTDPGARNLALAANVKTPGLVLPEPSGPVRAYYWKTRLGTLVAQATDHQILALYFESSAIDTSDLEREPLSIFCAQRAMAPEGTDFQRRVWSELIKTGFGETLSYSVLAERIGRPGARRAVGSAIAANPIAVLIPCHRIIRADGAIGGYRWDPSRKRALIAAEQALGSLVRA